MAKDNEVLESIMTIVSDRAAVSKPAGGGGASEAAASFLSGLGGGDDHASGRSSRDRDRDRCDFPGLAGWTPQIFYTLLLIGHNSSSARFQ